jgi:CoA enzyme activase uncharacterised domain (DUF2229)
MEKYMRIGLPDTLLDRHYTPFWEAYLGTLEIEVVKATADFEQSFDAGSRLMPNEPATVQLFVGRVLELADIGVDAIIVPDLNPGAEPGEKAGRADPWAVDLASVLAQRVSLPTLEAVPAYVTDPTSSLTSGIAVRLGQAWTQNTRIVQRGLDRAQLYLKAARTPEPNWNHAGRNTIGVIGEAGLLEQPWLWREVKLALEAAGLHAVLATQLPRERLIEAGKKRRSDLTLETDLEVVGSAVTLEAKGQVRGLISLRQPNANMHAILADEVLRKAHKPTLAIQFDEPELQQKLEAFAATL